MDSIVLESRKLLGDALNAVSGNDRYNDKHPLETVFPNGAADFIRMLMENVIRLDATNDRDKAVDYLGYAALFLAWIREGCPKSKYAYIAERYRNLFKIQERHDELQMLEGKLNCDRCCGSGMIRVDAQGVGVCPECNGTGGQNCCDGAPEPTIEEEAKQIMESTE